MPAIKVGVREFREQITRFLESETPVAVTRRGETLGVYVPAPRKASQAETTDCAMRRTDSQPCCPTPKRTRSPQSSSKCAVEGRQQLADGRTQRQHPHQGDAREASSGIARNVCRPRSPLLRA